MSDVDLTEWLAIVMSYRRHLTDAEFAALWASFQAMKSRKRNG